MHKMLKVLIMALTTVILVAGFYFFFPHVWGEIVYPLDYQESIKKYSDQWGLNANFVCAIMYTESHFNPQANSGVGARGLMQIMPATGRSIAEELGETNYSADNLYDPDTNIRYGSYYIKGLLDKYDGNYDYALAGYNAGVPRADRWREDAAPLPTETVFFIAKVKNTKDAYDKVYGQWWAEPQVQRPSPFYQGVRNFTDFVQNIILGKL